MFSDRRNLEEFPEEEEAIDGNDIGLGGLVQLQQPWEVKEQQQGSELHAVNTAPNFR